MLRRLFLHNIEVKVMALVMAVVLWFYARNEQTDEMPHMRAPLRISLPEGASLVEPYLKEVRLAMYGPRRALARVRTQGVWVGIQVEKVPADIEGPWTYPASLDPEDCRLTSGAPLPAEVTVSIAPTRVSLRIVRLARSRMKVELVLGGKPTPGYRIVEKFIHPDEVWVVGPKSTLKAAMRVRTKPVNVSGLTEEWNVTFPWKTKLEQTVEVRRDGKIVREPVTAGAEIGVYLTLGEVLETRSLAGVAIQVMAPPGYPFRVRPEREKVDIRVTGKKPALDALDGDDVFGYIAVGDLQKPGPYAQTVHFTMPPGIEVAQEPVKLNVEIIPPTAKGGLP